LAARERDSSLVPAVTHARKQRGDEQKRVGTVFGHGRSAATYYTDRRRGTAFRSLSLVSYHQVFVA